MSAKSADTAEQPPPKKKRGKILMAAAAAVLLLGGGGACLWLSGTGARLLGRHATAAAPAKPEGPKAEQAAYADVPDIIANLSATPRHQSFVKLKAKIELARAADQPAVAAGMPRLLDLFQTYLREMRPEELTGAAGSYRLREELVARANIALAPVRVTDILFIEILIQ